MFKQPSKKQKLDRFEDSGLTEKELEILDYVDQAENVQELDQQQLKKLYQQFETSLATNQEQRQKYSDQPLKYMESEEHLAEMITQLLRLSSQPKLYPLAVKLQLPAQIISLLLHDNVDIAIAGLNLINELVDEDVVEEASTVDAAGLEILSKDLLKNDLLPLLVTMLEKLDESVAEEKQGCFLVLSILENLTSIDPEISDQLDVKILQWLLKRLQVPGFDSVKQYASEMLSILVLSEKNKQRLYDLKAVEPLLQFLSKYRKKDPSDADETEMLENVFDTLSMLLSLESVKQEFMEQEGLELMLLMIKEKKLARMRAFKVLDHCLVNASQEICHHFVEIYGLKAVFGALMLKGMKNYKKLYKDYSQKELEEHTISIIVGLLRTLKDPMDVQRLFYKFVEDKYEKLGRCIDLFSQYQQKVMEEDAKIDQLNQKLKRDDPEQDYLDRMDAGLFSLQLLSLTLVQLCAYNQDIKSKTLELFGDRYDLETLELIVLEYLENLEDDSEQQRVTQILHLLKV
ncbi:Catenin-beta-like protein [Gorgonomyces haynaldii]|nr:Catenin-beta-like protein [Gorgonomyces haynaldii]